jgi:hypothetical protein
MDRRFTCKECERKCIIEITVKEESDDKDEPLFCPMLKEDAEWEEI